MKKFLLVSILILLISNSAFSQQSKFDSIFNLVSLETIRMKWAVDVADSLYKNAETEEQKARSSMLSASLLHKTGLINDALVHAKRADNITENANLYHLQARVCGLISTIYRTSGLAVQGKIYLEKALKASKRIKDESQSNKFLGNLHQEMAYYAMDEKNHKEAVNILNKGKGFFEKLSNSEERFFLLATNEELLAKNHVALNQFKAAFESYANAILFLDKSGKESALRGFIYNGMGNVSLAENEFDKAIQHYNQALEIAETSQFTALQDEVYQSLMLYYKTTKDQENYVKFNEKYLALRNESDTTSKISVNQVVDELHSKEKSAVVNVYKIAGASSVLILIGFGSFIYVRKKRKQDLMKFDAIIEELKQKTEKKESIQVSESVRTNETKDLIPFETEQKILEKLEVFENSTRFLSKGFALPMLAVELETNTKYLSHVIKKHKNSDFNNYINKLRIDYIINKLHDEPIYLNYKISYLAAECGFSSHSKFTTVFKAVTEMSPTVFLSLLAEGRNEKEEDI